MSSPKGFTLLELLVVIGILAVTVTASMSGYHKWTNRAKKAVCISKLRAIHSALGAAVTDLGEWPQIPLDEDGNLPKWDQAKYYQFWIKTMDPYGIGREAWVCPADESAVFSLKMGDEEKFVGSYVPTWFGPGANTPFRWNQPWVMERGGFHGNGLQAMPDGSITESANPFGGR